MLASHSLMTSVHCFFLLFLNKLVVVDTKCCCENVAENFVSSQSWFMFDMLKLLLLSVSWCALMVDGGSRGSTFLFVKL